MPLTLLLVTALSAALLAGTPRPCLAQTPGAAVSTLSTYGAPRIRLKGKAHVDASASKSAEVRILSGTVTDDALRPAPATVTLTLTRRSATTEDPGIAQPAPAALPLVATLPQACAGDEPPVLETSTRLALRTDVSGRFCVRLHLPPDRYLARLAVRATPLLDEGVRELSFDSSVDDVTLRFAAEPLTVSLESDESSIEVDAFADPPHGPIPAPGLVLELVDETGSRLGEATTDAFGQAQFHVTAVRLGQPGRGVLRATFTGNGTFGSSAREASVEKRLGVRLVLPDVPVDGTLARGRPEEGIALRVRAVPVGTNCPGVLPTGVVEARVGDTVVGAGMLARGESFFVARFGTRGPGPVPLTLRYVPDAPWFQPRAELHAIVPVRGPSPWTRFLTVLAGAAALAWFVGARPPGRWRLAPRARAWSTARPGAWSIAAGRAGVRVETERTNEGWRGRVVDAHDGAPVGGARIRIERPTFGGCDLVAHTDCDAGGRFVLSATAALPGDRFVAEGNLHTPLRQAVPPAGEVTIALVLRRRAILDRLISWARRHPGPIGGRPEPTPSEIGHFARSQPTIARWASEVERAAFGAAPVDAHRQAEVDRHAADGGNPVRNEAEEARGGGAHDCGPPGDGASDRGPPGGGAQDRDRPDRAR